MEIEQRRADHRLSPVEITLYSVDATITKHKLESGGDFHLVLTGTSGATMVAEVPNPDPEFVPASSRWHNEIAKVRQQIREKLNPERQVKLSQLRVRLVGVGFFDMYHAQMGMARNG